MFLTYFKSPIIFLLNTLPVIGLISCIYFLTNSIGISYALSSIIVLLGSYVNYYKIQFRNDPFMFEDLLLIKEASKMLGNYKPEPNLWLIVIVVVTLAFIILLNKFITLKVRKITRKIGILVTLVVFFIIIKVYPSQTLYQYTQSKNLKDSGNQLEQYSTRGFIYPFFHSINYSRVTKPTGYNKGSVQNLLHEYGYDDIPENKKVNVIAVMLEAYNDFNKFENLTFNSNPYSEWEALKKEAYYGEVVTNIFAGGTVDTERSFLTGYKNLPNFRKKTPSYVDYFKEQGYTVEGVHPYYNWYYNRQNINKNIGFDNYYFYENGFYNRGIYLDVGEGLLPVISDQNFFSTIIEFYEKNKVTSKPYFNFSISLEMHGSYPTNISPSKVYIPYKKEYDESIYNMCNYYFYKVENTNRAIAEFIEYFRQDDEPVIIIFFGDHNPYLGEDNVGYNMLGINLDTNTEEGFYNYYSVPYLIWGNQNAKEVLGKPITGKGPTISSCFLMNELFNVLGLKGNEYLNATNEIYKKIQVIKSPFYKKGSKTVSELTANDLELINLLEQLQYYLIYNAD